MNYPLQRLTYPICEDARIDVNFCDVFNKIREKERKNHNSLFIVDCVLSCKCYAYYVIYFMLTK